MAGGRRARRPRRRPGRRAGGGGRRRRRRRCRGGHRRRPRVASGERCVAAWCSSGRSTDRRGPWRPHRSRSCRAGRPGDAGRGRAGGRIRRIGSTRARRHPRGVGGGDGEVPASGQSMVWGMGRAIVEERPELWGGLVDLDPDETWAAAAPRLAAELRADEREPGGRLARRCPPRRPPRTHPTDLGDHRDPARLDLPRHRRLRCPWPPRWPNGSSSGGPAGSCCSAAPRAPPTSGPASAPTGRSVVASAGSSPGGEGDRGARPRRRRRRRGSAPRLPRPLRRRGVAADPHGVPHRDRARRGAARRARAGGPPPAARTQGHRHLDPRRRARWAARPPGALLRRSRRRCRRLDRRRTRWRTPSWSRPRRRSAPAGYRPSPSAGRSGKAPTRSSTGSSGSATTGAAAGSRKRPGCSPRTWASRGSPSGRASSCWAR